MPSRAEGPPGQKLGLAVEALLGTSSYSQHEPLEFAFSFISPIRVLAHSMVSKIYIPVRASSLGIERLLVLPRKQNAARFSGIFENIELPRWLGGNESTCQSGDARDVSWISGVERPPGRGMATHSSILAWKIPRAEEPGGLESMGLQRVGYN